MVLEAFLAKYPELIFVFWALVQIFISINNMECLVHIWYLHLLPKSDIALKCHEVRQNSGQKKVKALDA